MKSRYASGVTLAVASAFLGWTLWRRRQRYIAAHKKQPRLSVAVGSSNPVKLNACERAFQTMFPGHKIRVVPVPAPSGVSDQPFTDEETKTGAVNRANACWAKYKEKFDDHPDFAVGLEGGVQEIQGSDGQTELECFAWMAIKGISDNGKLSVSFARTGSFSLPSKVAQLVHGTFCTGT